MNNVAHVLDMIKKMVQNNEPHDKIMQFINATYPGLNTDFLKQDIQNCKGCGLHGCRHTTFIGSVTSPVMFVGEAPGEQEEKQGLPFVGPAGELFTRMLTSAGEKLSERWHRENVYITNTIKCRPTDARGSNRAPDMKEIAACKGLLDKEIALVNPKIIICVGATAANTLIHPDFKITDEHGKMFGDKRKLMAIYHPSYILRKDENSPEGIDLKRQVWSALTLANQYLNSLGPEG